ncbi:hypothetical protein [Cryobacterium sp. GrIS_2_6]|uniref:hypothetical protein n=1 Tax=Cryobacterium sp. GrIS_2_6 TaxID=3162785 RepID=UPI002E0B5974|nr:hypothetical protein [Cryobacterium psychrotolerans]
MVAHYTQELTANGWTQTMDNPDDTLASGLPGHVTAWEKAKLNLTYEVDVWGEGETTKYFTQLEAMR